VSYVEIYKETLRDLLDPSAKPEIHEDVGGRGVHVTDCAVYHCASIGDVMDAMQAGLLNRGVCLLFF
jgi:hypothetical protein